MKLKLLCILHHSPPMHGAAKVGDFVKDSKKLNSAFRCKFIKIKTYDNIGDSGKISLKKIYLAIELYFKVLWTLVVFRPHKIYFTASIKGVAFYRDLILSTLWKIYNLFRPVDIYYHYHTKGMDKYVAVSKLNYLLTRFFLNKVNLILLSPMLEKDFEKVQTFKKIFYLPNGVENTLEDIEFNALMYEKYKQKDVLEVLYLSNMIKSKGYFSVLELANETKDQLIQYHFAGEWKDSKDKKEFFDYIKKNKLDETVTFHGFVNADKKQKLFERAHFFVFPTRYKNEAFPLSILEALSYGLIVIATDEGSIPYILDNKSGIVLTGDDNLLQALEIVKEKFINIETAKYCRKRYLEHFTLGEFEKNLVKTLISNS